MSNNLRFINSRTIRSTKPSSTSLFNIGHIHCIVQICTSQICSSNTDVCVTIIFQFNRVDIHLFHKRDSLPAIICNLSESLSIRSTGGITGIVGGVNQRHTSKISSSTEHKESARKINVAQYIVH